MGLVKKAIRDGKKSFYKSDIKDFFTEIPKDESLTKVMQ
jgi:hypothetical protein